MRNEAPPRIIGKDYHTILDTVFPSFEEEYWNKEPITAIGIGTEITRRGNERFIIKVYLTEELTSDHPFRLPKTFRGVPIRTEITSGFFAGATKS